MRPSRIPRAPVAPAALGVLLVALAVAAPPLAAQQLAPPSTGGVAALERALERLAQNRRVLVIGAHPDDEDTELLVLLARGMGAEAAYLSLSRGEGGQNLIGVGLGPALGLLRNGPLTGSRLSVRCGPVVAPPARRRLEARSAGEVLGSLIERPRVPGA